MVPAVGSGGGRFSGRHRRVLILVCVIFESIIYTSFFRLNAFDAIRAVRKTFLSPLSIPSFISLRVFWRIGTGGWRVGVGGIF